jgi:hypothetical protein
MCSRSPKPECHPFPKPASSDLFGGVPRNFQVFDALDFLAELTQHIPDKGEHLARYYGWYSHRCRGLRAAQDGRGKVTVDRELLEGAKTDAARRRQARSWAALIQRVWEVDPLKCAKCGGQMQVVSFIEARQEQVIRRILEHCGLWQGPPRQLPQPRPPPQRRRRPPPRDVQLVLDPEFVADPSQVRPSPAGRHLVLDPEYLTDRPRDAGTGQQVVPYD